MDEKKAEKMDKKIIWEHTNYFRIKSNNFPIELMIKKGKIRKCVDFLRIQVIK